MKHNHEAPYVSDLKCTLRENFNETRQVPMQQQKQQIMPTGISYLFLCVSQPERSVVSELSGPGLNRRGSQVRGTLSSSDLLFFLGLKNTPRAFHPRLCTQRNRKRLHHRLHPSSPAKRPVTFIDFWLSLLTTSHITDSQHYSWHFEHCSDYLLYFVFFCYFCSLFFVAVNYGSRWQLFESDTVLLLEAISSSPLRQA